ncbi:hypothetical protein CW304_11355 [Bacillus sp. UFRGS-B20]|nr:hypothetical protein CW304_11355 [Bacillus sp. UFRGS-B20]
MTQRPDKFIQFEDGLVHHQLDEKLFQPSKKAFPYFQIGNGIQMLYCKGSSVKAALMSLYAPSFNCHISKIYSASPAGCSNLHIVWTSLFSLVVFEVNVLNTVDTNL